MVSWKGLLLPLKERFTGFCSIDCRLVGFFNICKGGGCPMAVIILIWLESTVGGGTKSQEELSLCFWWLRLGRRGGNVELARSTFLGDKVGAIDTRLFLLPESQRDPGKPEKLTWRRGLLAFRRSEALLVWRPDRLRSRKTLSLAPILSVLFFFRIDLIDTAFAATGGGGGGGEAFALIIFVGSSLPTVSLHVLALPPLSSASLPGHEMQRSRALVLEEWEMWWMVWSLSIMKILVEAMATCWRSRWMFRSRETLFIILIWSLCWNKNVGW